MKAIRLGLFSLVAVGLLGHSAALFSTTSGGDEEEFNHVWVHYDYMIFPPGWTSAGGTTFPNGLSMAPPQAAIDKVVEAFRAQGLTLHIDPIHNAIPGHQVIIPDFDPWWRNATPSCVGPDAVSFLALKQQYFQPQGDHPWHYAIFGFNVGLPDTSADGSACPRDQLGFEIDPTSSGWSELPGFNFILALGYPYDAGNTFDDFFVGGNFMHELGHNFGLEHGGVVGGFEQSLTHKPNYISVMNYSYSSGGIPYAAAPGSSQPIGRRLDYSSFTGLTLNETDLNEFAGVGGPADDTDIVIYCANAVGCALRGPSVGPIDWNNDGVIEAHAAGDIDNDSGAPSAFFLLHGFDDWSYVKQQLRIPPDLIEAGPKRLVHESGPKSGLSPVR